MALRRITAPIKEASDREIAAHRLRESLKAQAVRILRELPEEDRADVLAEFGARKRLKVAK